MKAKKKDNFDDLITITALGLGAYFLFFSGDKSGGGSEGGSFIAPLVLTPSGEQGTPYTIGSGSAGVAVTKKDLTTVEYNSMASYIPILNSPGVQANPLNKALSIPIAGTATPGNPYGYGRTPLENPGLAATKKAQAANTIRQAAGQPSYSWYGGF
jgi:hypothetical protein